MNIPLKSINISEEVNKTGIWKEVNNKTKNKNGVKEQKSRSGKKKYVIHYTGKQNKPFSFEVINSCMLSVIITKLVQQLL